MSEKSMIFNGRYQIEKILGEGGLGVVYRAHDLKLNSKPVAVKVLKEEIRQNAYWNRKFGQEKEALARCQNPHIVGVHDSGTSPSGDLFLVMEYVEGAPLGAEMMREKMSFKRVANIVRQIGNALSYAHERAIFHRDLKPGNIMLRKDDGEDFVILIDFGIATVMEPQTVTRGPKTLAVGTVPYMAPEQILCEPSEATDTFALGVVAYEMLTGQKPFPVPHHFDVEIQMGELYAMQRGGLQVMPKSLRPDLPQAAQTAILKALAFDPKDRYRKSRDFGEALARALLGDDDITEPVTVPLPAESQSAEVVIAYCGQDLRQALELAERLKEAGAKTWMADHGHEIIRTNRCESIQAIRQCKVVLLLCSDAALRSERVKQELQLAWIHERPFLPCLIEPLDFPDQAAYWFEGKRWIDAVNMPPDRWFPVVLKALLSHGVRCPGIKPAGLDGAPVIEPTRLDDSLESLWSVASFTDQIWPLPAGEGQLVTAHRAVRGLGAPQEDVQHGYRLGSRVRLAIEIEHLNHRKSSSRGLGVVFESEFHGHLLLLDKGPEGILYCLCPSAFAPDTRLRSGRNDFPQMESRYPSFQVTGKPGREHLLAIVTDEPLGLDWMPRDPAKEPARVLCSADIDVLLARLRGLAGDRWTAMSTYFDVVG
ncbi:MAG: protein kinase domain-containing protein [Methylococcales bacterium]